MQYRRLYFAIECNSKEKNVAKQQDKSTREYINCVSNMIVRIKPTHVNTQRTASIISSNIVNLYGIMQW